MNHHEPPFFGISHPEITTSRHLEREREERDASEMQKEAVMAAQLEAIGDSPKELEGLLYPIGSMYAIYGNIYHPYPPNVSIYTIHGSYGYGLIMCNRV